jgi:hypothetical protein
LKEFKRQPYSVHMRTRWTENAFSESETQRRLTRRFATLQMCAAASSSGLASRVNPANAADSCHKRMVGYKRNVSKDDPSYLPAQYQANPLKPFPYQKSFILS